MKLKSFRYCMIIGALSLAGLALSYFIRYFRLDDVLTLALSGRGLELSLTQSIRALWLAFAFQGLLIGILYALVAWKPHAVSREVIVILGLLQLVEAVLQFSFAGSGLGVALLVVAALCVLLGSALWPKRAPPPPVTYTLQPTADKDVRIGG